MVVRGRGRVVMARGRRGREGEMGERDKGCQGGKGEATGTVRLDSLPRTWGETFESLFCPRKTPMPSPAPKQTIYQTQKHGF